MAEEKNKKKQKKQKKDGKKTKAFYDWATTGIPVMMLAQPRVSLGEAQHKGQVVWHRSPQ